MAWPVRYNMIGLLFLSTVVNYIDRVNISVAAPVIMKETGWDKGQFGLVFSAFLIGYALLWSPRFARVRFPGIGVALSLPFLMSATLVSSPVWCVMLLVAFYLLFVSAISGYTTVALEFNPHAAGSIFGLISMLGSFAGILGPMTAGFMLSQSGGDWTLPFLVAAAVGAVCAVILFVVPIRPIAVNPLVPVGIVTKEAAP